MLDTFYPSEGWVYKATRYHEIAGYIDGLASCWWDNEDEHSTQIDELDKFMHCITYNNSVEKYGGELKNDEIITCA